MNADKKARESARGLAHSKTLREVRGRGVGEAGLDNAGMPAVYLLTCLIYRDTILPEG